MNLFRRCPVSTVLLVSALAVAVLVAAGKVALHGFNSGPALEQGVWRMIDTRGFRLRYKWVGDIGPCRMYEVLWHGSSYIMSQNCDIVHRGDLGL